MLLVTLVVFPLGYLLLCRRMDRTIPNPPKKEFFFIFGSVAGYLLLCTLLMPSPAGLLAVFPFMLCACIALAGSCCSAMRAIPRTGYHIAAAGISGCFVAVPLIVIVFKGIVTLYAIAGAGHNDIFRQSMTELTKAIEQSRK